jgi:hypothetical protein
MLRWFVTVTFFLSGEKSASGEILLIPNYAREGLSCSCVGADNRLQTG